MTFNHEKKKKKWSNLTFCTCFKFCCVSHPEIDSISFILTAYRTGNSLLKIETNFEVSGIDTIFCIVNAFGSNNEQCTISDSNKESIRSSLMHTYPGGILAFVLSASSSAFSSFFSAESARASSIALRSASFFSDFASKVERDRICREYEYWPGTGGPVGQYSYSSTRSGKFPTIRHFLGFF